MKPRLVVVAGVLAGFAFGAPESALARPGWEWPDDVLAGLEHPVRVVRDRLGVPHVYARSDHDAFFVNGYLQAQDRFFEMDAAPFFSRRAADGTRSEVMGPGAFDEVLGSDLLFRSLGLRRAAERSAAAYPAWVMADLQAYADGVNLWLARNPLPPEYAALELSKASVRPWTPVDSIAIFKHLTAAISFTNFAAELENTGLLLGYEDVGRARRVRRGQAVLRGCRPDRAVRSHGVDSARRDERRAGRAAGPAARGAGAPPRPARGRRGLRAPRPGARLGRAAVGGSNWWLVSGAKSATGFPLLAGDPHLPLPSPPVWHEIGLSVAGHGRDVAARRGGGTRHRAGMNVYGGRRARRAGSRAGLQRPPDVELDGQPARRCRLLPGARRGQGWRSRGDALQGRRRAVDDGPGDASGSTGWMASG